MRPEGACGDRGREIWPMIQTSLKPGLARLRELSPLECTDTKNAPASPLECTDTNSLDLKSFRFHCYKKGGWGVPAASCADRWGQASGCSDRLYVGMSNVRRRSRHSSKGTICHRGGGC